MLLYHATLSENIPSIMKNGLLPPEKSHTNWPDISTAGYIYLAFDPKVAVRFVKRSPGIPKSKKTWNQLSLIVVDSANLDLSHIWYDWNVKCEYENEIISLAYDGNQASAERHSA